MNGLENSDKIAVAVSRYYSRAKLYDRKVNCFKSPYNLRSYLVMLKMRDGSVRHTEWNRLIQRFSEAGLIAKWARSTTGPIGIRKEYESDAAAITINHLFGIYGFAFCSLITALLVAILEQIVHFKLNQRNHYPLWDLLDRLIDGRRHWFIYNRNNINRN